MTEKKLNEFERFFFGYCVGMIDHFLGANGAVTQDQIKQYLGLRARYLGETAIFKKGLAEEDFK